MARRTKIKESERREVVFTEEQKKFLCEKLKIISDEIEEIRKHTGVDRILVNVCSSYETFEAVTDNNMKRIVRSMKLNNNEWKDILL